ncbi:hypothetical protein HAX54_018523 [Datura stramonium]|uniref:Uncharacterized protein n=1 Tax=Datura stramonium TaxID=4076 RepID=A0ABS8UPQ9_DATST|nr:hypothetical protein [Datura stramonium]
MGWRERGKIMEGFGSRISHLGSESGVGLRLVSEFGSQVGVRTRIEIKSKSLGRGWELGSGVRVEVESQDSDLRVESQIWSVSEVGSQSESRSVFGSRKSDLRSRSCPRLGSGESGLGSRSRVGDDVSCRGRGQDLNLRSRSRGLDRGHKSGLKSRSGAGAGPISW